MTGLGVVSPSGLGREALFAALGDGAAPVGHEARALEGFDVREQLGRKGTLFHDRCTGLALVACREALEDGGEGWTRTPRDRVGVTLGTTLGSLRSMSEYTRETLVEQPPYLVNPGLFPNTVMNCATAQAAIRHDLRGVNATVAGGPLAFLAALRLAARALRLGDLDATLAGAVEELSPQRCWQTRQSRRRADTAVPGEGAAVVMLERTEDVRAAGRHVDAQLEAVTTAFCPGGELGGGLTTALARCVRCALAQAGVAPEQVAAAVCCESAEAAALGCGRTALRAALAPARPRWVSLTERIGDCGAASAGLHLAALLMEHRTDPERDGSCSVIAAWTPEGGVGAAVVRGFSRAVAEEAAAR